jgi:hypothetical protein
VDCDLTIEKIRDLFGFDLFPGVSEDRFDYVELGSIEQLRSRFSGLSGMRLKVCKIYGNCYVCNKPLCGGSNFSLQDSDEKICQTHGEQLGKDVSLNHMDF